MIAECSVWVDAIFFCGLPSGRQSDGQPGHQTGQQGDRSQGKLPPEPRQERSRREKEKNMTKLAECVPQNI